jgi:outer membrane protein, multidrug efflux system
MDIKQILPIIGAVLLLNGCVMMPKYTRPASPIPAGLPGGDAEGQYSPEAVPVVGLKWQDVFSDAKLQEVIDIALLNNRDLRLAVLNVERSRGMYGIQKANLFPALTASGAGVKQRVPADLSSTGRISYSEKYSVDLGIASWEVDLFGRIRSLNKQALEEYLGTEQARRGAQTTLVSEVARVYLTMAADRENLKLAQVTLEAQRSVYGVIWQQYDKGVATESDLRRAQTQVDAAREDVARYIQLAAQDRNALDLLAGTTISEDLLPVDLASVSPLGTIAPGFSSDVLLRRPDIMAAEHQLKAANAFIGAARAAFFPRISLTTMMGTASSELDNLFSSGSGTWSFAPQVAMPIFDPRVFAAYRVSKAQREISLVQYEKTIQTAFREVADALAVRATVDQQVAAQESIVESAQKIYEISDQRYTQGIDGYLSVLDAQRSLYAAQQQLTALRLARLANQVRLYAVFGGDYDLR